jgi:hypothetical protein
MQNAQRSSHQPLHLHTYSPPHVWTTGQSHTLELRCVDNRKFFRGGRIFALFCSTRWSRSKERSFVINVRIYHKPSVQTKCRGNPIKDSLKQLGGFLSSRRFGPRSSLEPSANAKPLWLQQEWSSFSSAN